MERIKLSKREKSILRELRRGNDNVPAGIDNFSYFDAVVSLTEKRLVRSKTNYDEVLDVQLTPKGYAYTVTNPHLLNPVNWSKLAAIAGIITAIATAALFYGLQQNQLTKRMAHGTHKIVKS